MFPAQVHRNQSVNCRHYIRLKRSYTLWQNLNPLRKKRIVVAENSFLGKLLFGGFPFFVMEKYNYDRDFIVFIIVLFIM
jgi:hypothetical protein